MISSKFRMPHFLESWGSFHSWHGHYLVKLSSEHIIKSHRKAIFYFYVFIYFLPLKAKVALY